MYHVYAIDEYTGNYNNVQYIPLSFDGCEVVHVCCVQGEACAARTLIGDVHQSNARWLELKVVCSNIFYEIVPFVGPTSTSASLRLCYLLAHLYNHLISAISHSVLIAEHTVAVQPHHHRPHPPTRHHVGYQTMHRTKTR